MKCPYRKAVYIYRNSHDSETERHEEYEDCYKDDCPYYVPEKRWSNFVTSEACGRTISNERR